MLTHLISLLGSIIISVGEVSLRLFLVIKNETHQINLWYNVIANKTLKGSDYMSHTDYTRNILNIKDKNITFEENCLEDNYFLNRLFLLIIFF